MAPPIKMIFSDGLEYELNQLDFIWLIPFKNPNRWFKLRRCTFPQNKSILLHVEKHFYGPMPSQEQVVLSTSQGNAFAIVQSGNVLARIYSYPTNCHSRRHENINMESGVIIPLSRDEILDVLVGTHNLVYRNFRVECVNKNHLHH